MKPPNESTIREKAKRMGYYVTKSRQGTHPNNHGLYRLVEADRNFVVLGENYDATLVEIERWLEKRR
jgi:hypothetical protein